MARRFDIAVVGLGVMGAMTAWQAAEHGARVVAFERFTPGHPHGSSHGGSRIFRQLLFEGGQYVPLARASLPLYRQLERRGGAELLRQCGGLVIGPADGPLIAAARASAELGSVEHRVLDRDAVRARFPQHALTEHDIALYEPTAGVIMPEAAVRAAVAAAAALGARIETGSRCLAVEQHDDGAAIITEAGSFRARRVVLAAGGWAGELVPELPLRVQRSVLSWFAPREGFRGDFPVFVRNSGSGLHGWGIPDIDGRGLKVGLSGPLSPKRWLDRAEDNLAAPPTTAETDPVADFVARALPEVHPSPASAQACMDTRTPDGHFVVGSPARRPELVLCGGFAGHGFKHAPAVGRAAAQLALEGGTELPIAAFSPDRFAL